MMGFRPNDPNAAKDRQNVMMAVVVSMVILLLYHFFVDMPRQEKAMALAKAKAQQEKAVAPDAAAKTEELKEVEFRPRDEVLHTQTERRISIKGAHIMGSFSTKGARIADLTLNDHYVDIEEHEPIALLTPFGTEAPSYTDSGWLGDNLNLPNEQSVWSLAPGSPEELVGGGKPVVMTWSNGEGLSFERSISLDENYLFTIKQTVRNDSGAEVKLHAYNLYARNGVPRDFTGFYTLHEGPIAYLNEKQHELSYSDLADGRSEWLQMSDAKGWIGITEKYWMVALLPPAGEMVKARAVCKVGKKDCTGGLNNPPGQHFQTDVRSDEVTVAPGGTATDTMYIYAGVKNLDVMRDYQEKYGFDKLELGLDFGIYYIITKPFYFILHFLINATGNVGLAILLMTIIVRIFVFPLASKSFRSMAKMKLIAPKMKELQETYKDDKAKLQMEIYELYRKEDANPFSGCWPILVQIPIIFALYKVILISVDLRHAPFWGWIKDLSAPDPTTVFNLFGLIPWDPPSVLMIGAWPCLFCLTMILQKRISPPMADATQERLQTWFPYIATVMMAQFSVGLIIYWTWSNVLSIFQQYYILRTYGGEDTSLIRGHVDRRKKKKSKKDKG